MLAVPARQVARRLIDRCSPYAERLGCVKELGYIEDVIEHGSGATLQRNVYEQTKDFKKVTQAVVDATGQPWDPISDA